MESHPRNPWSLLQVPEEGSHTGGWDSRGGDVVRRPLRHKARVLRDRDQIWVLKVILTLPKGGRWLRLSPRFRLHETVWARGSQGRVLKSRGAPGSLHLPDVTQCEVTEGHQ